MSMPDVKPDIKPDVNGQVMQIKIKSNHDTDASIIFKVKPTTKFSKVAEAWGKQKGVDPKQFKFLGPEGERIHHTPENNKKHWGMTMQELELEDEDEICAMKEQVGGCSA